MAFMTSLLYLSCFFYTLTLVIMYHVLYKIYLALQLQFYVMFFLSGIKILYLILYLVSCNTPSKLGLICIRSTSFTVNNLGWFYLKLASNWPQSEHLHEQKDFALFLMLWLSSNAIFLIIYLELGFLLYLLQFISSVATGKSNPRLLI